MKKPGFHRACNAPPDRNVLDPAPLSGPVMRLEGRTAPSLPGPLDRPSQDPTGPTLSGPHWTDPLRTPLDRPFPGLHWTDPPRTPPPASKPASVALDPTAPSSPKPPLRAPWDLLAPPKHPVPLVANAQKQFANAATQPTRSIRHCQHTDMLTWRHR